MPAKKNKLPKRYIKKYGISAKAWREYRKGTLSGGAKKKKKAVKKKAVKKAVRKTTTKKRTLTKSVRGNIMAKKRTYKKRKKSKSKRVGAPRAMRLISGKTVNAITDGVLVGGGAVGSTFALNMIPFVKEQNAWIKAAIQAGVGVLGMGMFKNAYVKKLMAGSVAGAAISMIIPLMPESFKFAGGREFTEDELLELQQMGIPVSISDPDDDTLSGPVTIMDPDESAVMGYTKSRRGRY